MRYVLLVALALVVSPALAARPVVVITAQDHAVLIARRGALVHSSCGQTEGIGYGATPEEARRNCCYYREALAGRRVIVEEGIAYSPARRAWFAVIRYR
jgi:hypothetical protein